MKKGVTLAAVALTGIIVGGIALTTVSAHMTNNQKNLIEEFVGLNRDEVKELKNQGLTFDQILEQQGLTKEEFDQFLDDNDIVLPIGRHLRHNAGEQLSDFLGIDQSEIREMHDNGMNLEEILISKGKTLDEFKSFVKENLLVNLKEKLDAGEISEEEYNNILERIEDGDFKPMEGRRHRMGHITAE